MKTLTQIALNDRTVYDGLKRKATLTNIIEALVAEKYAMRAKISELESIAPRRIRTAEGKVYIWRCPEELVPETKL